MFDVPLWTAADTLHYLETDHVSRDITAHLLSYLFVSSASVWQKRQSILQNSDRDLNNITVEVDSMSSSIGLFKVSSARILSPESTS